MIGVVILCDGCGEECNDEPCLHTQEVNGPSRSYCGSCNERIQALFAPPVDPEVTQEGIDRMIVQLYNQGTMSVAQLARAYNTEYNRMYQYIEVRNK